MFETAIASPSAPGADPTGAPVSARAPSSAEATAALALALDDVRRAAATEPTAALLIGLLVTADALTASAVGVLGHLGDADRARSLEAATGLPAEIAIRLSTRRARWDARELLAATEVLAHMPATRAALERGTISWSQARAIARSARALDASARTTLDAMIGRRAPSLVEAEPEQLIAEADDAVADLLAARERRREDRAIERSFLVLQPALGGGGTLYGEADTERFATIAGALEDAAGRPTRDDDDHNPDEGTTRARQRMDALVAICESHLAGAGGGRAAGTRPRPRLIATTSLAELAKLGASEAARVLTAVAGRPQRLTPLATEVLACDADIVTVLFDGARPVAVGDVTATVPGKIRTAIVARDGGCRFPGCSAPAAWTDVHHIVGRASGGSNAVDNLVLLCRRCHRRVHRHRWLISIRDDGAIEFRLRGMRYVSYPRAPGIARE